jgi:hypothetical protein
MFNMKEWLAYSITDMRESTCHGPVMNITGFKWAAHDAWAMQMIEKRGLY